MIHENRTPVRRVPAPGAAAGALISRTLVAFCAMSLGGCGSEGPSSADTRNMAGHGAVLKAVSTPVPPGVQLVYRFAKTSNGAYFYTGDAGERDVILSSFPDFRYEGTAFLQGSGGSAVPVYRFANLSNGGYFFTASAEERDATIRSYPNMRYEGSTFSATRSDAAGAVPIYRLANLTNGAYLYTSQASERDFAVGLGIWRSEGIGFYALTEVSQAIPLARARASEYAGVGTALALNGSASSDPVGRSLTYSWRLTAKPEGSVAALNSADSSAPEFIPDRTGTYTISLTVANGIASSEPSTVTVAVSDFVRTSGTDFYLNGSRFRFGGNNASIIANVEPSLISAGFSDVKSLGMKVVRVWAYNEIGSIDNSVQSIVTPSSRGGGWYQYWDIPTSSPKLNESSLRSLDSAVAEANKKGLKIIMTLTNNWANLGGADQYNIWFGTRYHDDFFTSRSVISAYRQYIQALLTRRNSVTGVVYKDDPTILSWELGNELFCFTDDYSWRAVKFVASPNCNANTITSWADEISTFIRGIDRNHLISMGNVGFLNRGRSDEYSNRGGDDFEATLSLQNIDFGTFHLYIDNPSRPYDVNWGVQWIRDHVSAARAIGKPVVLEEFGHEDRATRDLVLGKFLEAFIDAGGSGWLAWYVPVILPNGTTLGGSAYAITMGSSTAELLGAYAARMGN